MTDHDKPADKPPGLLRRLGAIVYDSLLLVAVLFFSTAILLPLNRGEAFQPDQLFYPVYLFAVSFLFFGWFWTHGGQTLGMRAWKLKVCSQNRTPISWPQALLRFTAALLSWSALGLGFIWILFNRNKCAWHDWLSNTRIVRAS
jgi:uncharacterized RDD family membrane protein YckC